MLMLVNPTLVGSRMFLAGWQPSAPTNPDVAAELAAIRAAGGVLVDDATLGPAASIARFAMKDPDDRGFLLTAALCWSAYSSGGGGAQTVVRVNATGAGGAQASPYAAIAGQTVVCDTSLGSVVVNLPALALGQGVTVAHDAATSLAVNTVTINRNGATSLEQPPPSNGTFGASYVIAGVNGSGMSLTWFNGGSAGGLLLR